MKLHLVDGPQHGTTMYVEGEPEYNIYVPGIICAKSMMQADDYSEPKSFMMNHIHHYQARNKTRQGTVIYEYCGEK